ncbi:molybdate ABC transporter substrate-binding protein [Tessaracoccus sp. Z1128]
MAQVKGSVWTVLLACAALASCGAEPDEAPVVFAASSLSTVLADVSPDARFSFDGSAGLVDQLSSGAPADVFLSADGPTMDRAVDAGLIEGEPRPFASNRLVVVVPAGNPTGVTGFDASLSRGKLVTCAPEVPCGASAVALAAAAGLELAPVSEETRVADVLGKVASGEADAGLAYATDAASSDGVESIEIPGADKHANTYWIAVLRDAPHPRAAREFVASVLGPWQDELRAAGFGPPA